MLDLCSIISLCTIAAVVYAVVQCVRIYFSDCDLALLWASKFGKPIASLRGKVIWITGSSSGIGEFLAYELAKGGARLVLSARRLEELERVKKECLTNGPLSDEDVLVLQLDVTDFGTHKDATDTVLKHFGHIDILVNNAGRSQRATWENISMEVEQQMLNLNVLGQLSLTKAVLPHMFERKSGQVAVMSSIAGKMGVPGSGSYTGAKHALHGYFECLRIETADRNVKITMLCPGPTFSNFLQHCFTENPDKEYGVQQNPEEKRLKTDRCAYLCAVAIANELDETWMALQPVLTVYYLSQYVPSYARKLLCSMGLAAVNKLREGKQ